MTPKTLNTFISRSFFALALVTFLSVACTAQEAHNNNEFIQYGELHKAIGENQDQGRVALTEIVGRPHFYGIGALAGLEGEITILDSTPVITSVTGDGHPRPMESSTAKATLLAGQSIRKWTKIALAEEVEDQLFDKTIGAAAAEQGIDVAKPFVFVVDGEFTDVRLHVIHGACPIRARMKMMELDKDKRPFEMEAGKLKGTLVGIYAADSVGKLTHPATTTHVHLIYTDKETGHRVTAHIEKLGLTKGSVLQLPANGKPAER